MTQSIAFEPTPPTPVVPASTVGVPSPDAPAATDSSSGVALPVVGAGLLLALAVGLVVGYLVRSSMLRTAPAPAPPTRSTAPTPTARPAAPPVPTSPPSAPTPSQASVDAAAVQHLSAQLAEEHRRTTGLVEALVEVRDRIDNPTLSDRVGAALEAAGWYTVDPVGGAFDPERHRSVDRDRTDDPARHRTVAITERVGYQDAAGHVLRLPEVVVYHHEPGPGGRG